MPNSLGQGDRVIFMKRIFVFVILFISSACSTNSEDSSGKSTPSKTLKYFGYSVVDCAWDDPNDAEVKTNYLDEVTGFSNIAQLCSFAPTDNIISRVQAMNTR